MITIGMFFDEYGSVLLEETPEKEMEDAKKEIEELIPSDHIKYKIVRPDKLNETPLDLYLIDIGGLCAIYNNPQIDYYIHKIIESVENKPGTLFILWSEFTCKWYKDAVEEEFPDLINNNNVIIRYPKTFSDSIDWQSEVKKWLGL